MQQKRIKMAIAALFMAATVTAMPASSYAQEIVQPEEPISAPMLGLMGTLYGSEEEIDDVTVPTEEEPEGKEEPDGNAERDNNEPGLPGVVIYLDTNQGR